MQEGVAEATLRFVKVLKGVRGDAPVASHGCTSSCVLDCHKNSAASSEKKPGGRSGWPGFQRLWATGDAELDAMLAGRFMKLCDEIGADAFALGSVLEQAAGQGMLASGNGEAALAELEKLASAGESLLRAPAMAWSMGAGKKASHEEDMQGVVMDCLGICRFAADAMVRSGEVREAVLELLRCLHGLGEEDLYLMAAAGLAAENGRGDA
jgi:aldehyde:ferredoxin oxidoreductase